MIVYLHVGLDKSGSSAIQRSLGINQSWLNDRGFYLPRTGRLFGGTHEGLFNGDDQERWGQLRQELGKASNSGMKAAVISWEGIHFLTTSRLRAFKELLNDFEIIPILYLRDQAELIQSGYFQKITNRKINLNVELFKDAKTELLPDSRNHEKKLEKLKGVFGANALDVRLYDREIFVDHDIVTDFYSALSLSLDKSFQFPIHDINPSLDLPSVMLLNLVDRFFEDAQGRKHLVNQLVRDMEKNGSQEKYFLTRPAVEEIREFYRESNTKVLNQYFPNSEDPELFPRASSACRTITIEEAYGYAAQNIARITNGNTPIVWNGEALGGSSLGLLCRQENGWSWAQDAGTWNEGPTSSISFTIPSIKLLRKNGSLLISTIGKYCAPNISTQLSLHGRVIYSGSIDNGQIELPLAELPEGYVAIEINHRSTSDPFFWKKAETNDKSVFLLKSISYILDF